ncbi:response regulator transcription factor [Corynebacterium sp. HS2168-gen11]|uniref:response regulator transcription factor n=1 Tax=Corynebacterium sp. HS2168-gen11 TaxID=2974027 RepID=UPI00216AF8FF|nr:response regulator transcription factor [Corynebacterium sp. HS2168-gen11]MCS4535727.1 response regulator transcription factor [Corynebacterium sp. HS2168-gen11]
MKIGLADDQALVRAGFAMVLDSQDDLEVVWQADDGEQALALATREPVDVVLMDIQMPRMNGIEATKAIVQQKLQTPEGQPIRVIVLTTFDTDNYVVASVEAGASGFLLKDSSPEALIESVRTVGESSAVISPSATMKLFRHLRQSKAEMTPVSEEEVRVDKQQLAVLNQGLLDNLTEREAEVLACMSFGWSNQEIAQRLFISLPTVKTHVGRILSKTGSRDRVHAALFAIRVGLVDPSSSGG